MSSCAAPASEHVRTAAPVATSTPSTPSAAPARASAPAAPSSAPPSTPSAEGTGPCAPASLAEFGYVVERELEARVTDFAVGTPPTVAIAAGLDVSVFDGKRWKSLPAIRATPSTHFRLFFGRDNQPRLMGYEGETEPRGFYRRFKAGSFQPEPSELGPLGAERGALYGVLGFTDPEVVCKPGEICLIKKLSGWARVPAHEKPVPVFLGHGGAFAFHDQALQRLEAKGFVDFTPAQRFEQPRSLWVDESGNPWVIDGNALRFVVGGQWRHVRLPSAGVAAIWGRGANDVFVAGAGGAAHFDGSNFRCLRELASILSFVVPAGDTLWFAGEGGAYRARPSKK